MQKYQHPGHHKHQPSNRPPQRTTRELAEEFGVTLDELRAALAHTTIEPPKPVRKTPQGSYYEHQPMRDWWKAHNEARGAS